MANPSAPGADAAYDRAVAAYQQGSYDVARQWALEALAQDAEHPRARALLSRLDSVRRPVAQQTPAAGRPVFGGPQAGASEVVSTDPTVLITRANRAPNPEPVEPTVLVRREDRQRRPEPDPYVPPPIPPRAPAPAAVSEPTVIVTRASRSSAASAPQQPPAAAPGPSWRDRMPKGPGAAGTRGVIVAVAAVAAAALVVVAAIAAFRWFWPGGQTLTLTKPTGGTILGPGLECGSHGSNCSVSRPTGDAVELIAQADDNYVFSGFTGDCAPTGRISMTQAHTCGATFDKVTAAAPAVTFPLTISKPTGGTLIGAGGILCGTLGNSCSADVPNGQPVTLHFEADAGYTFGAFTGECSTGGETTMTAAKTCGATFVQTSTPVANTVPRTDVHPRPRTKDVAEPSPAPAAPKPAVPSPSAPPAAPPSAPQVVIPPTPSPAQTPVNTDKPAAPPETAEDHAKKELQLLVRNYCSSLESLQADKVKALWPLAPVTIFRDQFRQYKTLRCTITAPPEFERLDARDIGGAQLKFGMKQEIQMRSGGAPIVQETIVTLVASRTGFQSPWLIDRVRHDPKPK